MPLRPSSTLIAISLICGSVVPFVLPGVAQARLDLYNPRKHYGDEHINIANPASRCTTAAFKQIYNNAVAQAKKDIATRSDAASKTYTQDIEIAWQAMQQPYCGFGAFGSGAAKKSFIKTIDRARTGFFAAAKGGTPPPGKSIALNSAPVVVTPTITPVVKPAPSVMAKVSFSADMKLGDQSDSVKAMQNILIRKGLLASGLNSGYFGALTERALIAFQLKQGIIDSNDSSAAGVIGPKTRLALMN